MRSTLTLLMVLLVAVSCLAAGTVVAEGPHAGEGPGPGSHKDAEGDLGDIEDFRTGDQHGHEGKKGDLKAGPVGQPPPEELGMVQLTYQSDGCIHPKFSPDGTRIAYMWHHGGGYREIWVMELDIDCWPPKVTARYPVTDGDEQCAYLEGWSPDGTQILFRSWYATSSSEDYNRLWTANADGSGVQQLKAGVGNNTCFGGGKPGYQSSFSPDGTQIAFTMGYSIDTYNWSSKDIYVMDSDGTNEVQLTFTDEACEHAPRWSPDGSRLLYTSYDYYDWPQDLWVMDADGGNKQMIVEDAHSWFYDWSPDGEWIIYENVDDFSSPTYFNRDIYKVRPDGSNNTRLTPSDDYCEHNSLVGPDGTILYRSDELNVNGTTGMSSTWVMRDDGSEKTMVNPWGGKWHDWSPDGQWIAIQEWYPAPDPPQIYIVRNPLSDQPEPPPCQPPPKVPAAGIWGSAAAAVMLAGLLVWGVRRRRITV